MSTNNSLEEFESLGGRLKLTAPASGYRGGIDPYLLAAFASGNGQILELGCGIGTATLALASRQKNTGNDVVYEGFDISDNNIDLATQNATQNQLDCRFFQHDIKDKKSLKRDRYDEVIMNPPYFEAQTYYQDEKTKKQLSNQESAGGTTLKDWIDTANFTLHAKGIITMIHRAERMDEILSYLKDKKFGHALILPLWPRAGVEAKLCLIKARKGSAKKLTLLPGLIMHEDGAKRYTPDLQKILYEGQSIKELGKFNLY